ncbi:hypothetical protein QCA50_003324 [Cerrena zonata]|uniref:Uncharacterized protein n=1 Tax=Cerrena zonata TaxID=2478898 RepID=A0AAW0GPC7_9APHY
MVQVHEVENVVIGDPLKSKRMYVIDQSERRCFQNWLCDPSVTNVCTTLLVPNDVLSLVPDVPKGLAVDGASVQNSEIIPLTNDFHD